MTFLPYWATNIKGYDPNFLEEVMKKLTVLLLILIMVFSSVSEVFAEYLISTKNDGFTPRADVMDNDQLYPDTDKKVKTIAEGKGFQGLEDDLENWFDRDFTFDTCNVNQMASTAAAGAIYTKKSMAEYGYPIKKTKKFKATLIKGSEDNVLREGVAAASDSDKKMSSSDYFAFNVASDHTDVASIVYSGLKIYDARLNHYVDIDMTVAVKRAGAVYQGTKWYYPDKSEYGSRRGDAIHGVFIGKDKGHFRGLPTVTIVGVNTLQLRVKITYANKDNPGSGKKYGVKTSVTYGDIDAYQAVGTCVDNFVGARMHHDANMYFVGVTPDWNGSGAEDDHPFMVATSNLNGNRSSDTGGEYKYKCLFYLDTTLPESHGYIDMTYTTRQSQLTREEKPLNGQSEELYQPCGEWSYFTPSVVKKSEPTPQDIDFGPPTKYVYDDNASDNVDSGWAREITYQDEENKHVKPSISHNSVALNQTFSYMVQFATSPSMYSGNASTDFSMLKFTDTLEDCLEYVEGSGKVYSMNREVVVGDIGADDYVAMNPTKYDSSGNEDITNLFDITTSGQTITASMKSSISNANKNDKIYGETSDPEVPNNGAILRFTFKVKIKSGYTEESIGNKYPNADIPNKADVTYQMRSDSSPTTKAALSPKQAAYSDDNGEAWNDATDTVYTRVGGTPPPPPPSGDNKVTLHKVDLNGAFRTEFMDAKFTIYDSTGSAIMNNVSVDSTGKIELMLPEGTYSLKETTFPVGWGAAEPESNNKTCLHVGSYDAPLTYSFSTKSEGVDIYVRNDEVPPPEPTYTLTVHKTDMENVPLSGAKFKLYKSNGSVVQSATAVDAYGIVEFSVNAGSYYLEETQAPTDYEPEGESGRKSLMRLDSPNGTEAFDVEVTGDRHVFVRNKQEPPRFTVTLHKEDMNGSPLTGASFVVKNATGGYTEVSTTRVNSNGIISYSLQAGTYYFQETEFPGGYSAEDTSAGGASFIHIGSRNATATNRFTVTNSNMDIYVKNKAKEIVVKKIDAETGSLLGGATLELYRSKPNGTTVGGAIATWSTSSENPKTLTNLETGDYYVVKETVVPTDYDRAPDKVFQVTADAEEQVITVRDPAKEGDITIKKTDGTSALVGAAFQLRKGSVSAPGESDPVTVDASGMVTFDGLKKNTTYYVVETTVPGGYSQGGPFEIRTGSDGMPVSVTNMATSSTVLMTNGYYEFVNNMVKTNIVLNKWDMEQTPLAGAVFNLSGETTAGQTFNMTSAETDDVDGAVTFTNVPQGSYTLIETKTPDNYIAIASRYKVEVAGDGSVVITNGDTGARLTEKLGSAFIVRNKPTNLKVIKESSDGTRLRGAHLAIYEGEIRGQGATGTPVVSFTTTTSPFSVTGKLKMGERYTLVETQAPTGYRKADNIIFTVTKEAESEQIIVMTDETVSAKITVRKTDGTDALTGAVFALRETVSGENIGSTQPVKNDGTATFHNLKPETTYYIVETQAPAGYQVGGPFQVDVDEDGELTVLDTRTNTAVSETNGHFDFVDPELPKGTLSFVKTLENTTTTLAGASFELHGKSDAGKDVYLVGNPLETTVNGQVTISDIPVGTYTLTETQTPTDHKTVADYRVVCAYNGSQTTCTLYKVSNGASVAARTVGGYPAVDNMYSETPKHDVVLIKKNDNGNVVPGVKFSLTRRPADGFAERTYYSGSDGKVTIVGLEAGEYYLTEVELPPGYTDYKTWTISVHE